MQLSDFGFDLPDELIAQEPLVQRDASRLLVVNRTARQHADRQFGELPGLLHPTDLLVINNTKVFPARLIGTTENGGRVEIFLISETGNVWETLARPAKRLYPGKYLYFEDNVSAEVLGKTDAGRVLIRIDTGGRDLYPLLDVIGKTPLPPYIKRDAAAVDTDRDRYQTVFASERGAIAAPTAGLHFTPDVLARIAEKGIGIVEITLHVGYGTFEPVRVENLAAHRVSPEQYSITAETVESLNQAKLAGRRIVAVGTTTTRALEANLAGRDEFVAGSYSADVTITPGHTFRAVDALLTNFHLPKSSLLVLTSTFGGHELIMSAYRHAVADGYRFYSYGDCMLIV
ncbi:MAG: tRNA preQ1(34) S-adenosylmethionine ribosyltransferase-isomerase QueA [Pyrinomonadaceae bacterium]